NGNYARYEYDGQDRRTDANHSTESGEIHVAHNTFDPAGNIIAVENANGGVARVEYDQWNRAWKTTDPDGFATESHLDGAGAKVFEKDGNGHIRHWSYDARGLLISYTDAEGASTSYTYDANGNTETVTFANSARSRTTYDAADRVLTVTEAEGAEEARTKRIVAYDKMGNPLEERDFNGNVTTYTYNNHNLVKSITDPDGKILEKEYYPTGMLYKEKNRRKLTTEYKYDALNRVVLVIDPLGQEIATAYDNVGNVTKVTDKRGFVSNNFYDSFNRLTLTEKGGVRLVANEYDPVSNLIAVTDAENNRTGHSYNARNLKETTGFADGSAQYFTYDGVGAMLTSKNEVGQVATYTYDKESRQK
ncbi:MAG: RHS repeat protein, partial [bacterium]|nr:RHS repeat protein [bacterium]